MTPRLPRRTWPALVTMLTVFAAACGGGSDNAASSVPSPTRTLGSTRAPTATPTAPPTPVVTPTTATSGVVTGVVVLQRSVAANGGDALAGAPSGFGSPADATSFDRALSHADWFVSGAADKRGSTTADGRFAINDLDAGHYGLQINRTLDGNLVAITVPFAVGDNGNAELLAEVAPGQVRSTSMYVKDGASVHEVVAPNGTQAVIRDGRVAAISDGGRTLTDDDGDGNFDSSVCTRTLFACDGAGRCGDETLSCSCTSSCPDCDNCVSPGVCAPPNGVRPYACDAESGCSRAGDQCVCVPSCPDCEDCPSKACVPSCAPIEIQSIEVGNVQPLVVGQQGSLNAAAVLSDGTAIDVTYLVVWQSSDASVATVDSWGLVSALSVGSTNITATLGTLASAPQTLAVAARPPVRRISLQNASCIFPLGTPESGDATNGPVVNPPARSDILPVPSCTQVVLIGSTIQFRAIGEFDSGYQDITDEVQWQVAPPNVGTVNDGLFTAVNAGDATLTATLDGLTSDPTDLHVVTQPSIVALSIYADNAQPQVVLNGPAQSGTSPCFDCGYTVSVLRGDTLRFHATAQYDIGTWKDVTDAVTWRSSDATVASIDGQGTMTAAQSGTVDITATLDTVVSSAVSVHVVDSATLQSIYISQQGGDAVVAKGDQRYFRAAGFYDVGGLTRDVTDQATWHSSDEQVGGFDTAGVFTGRHAGNVLVWAELNDLQSNQLSLQVFETSELTYCDPNHINRSVWSDDFNRVTLESDCADYEQPGVATLRYTVTETQPHGGVFRPCLDLYVYQGNTRVRTIREEGCGEPFLPANAPGAGDEAVKYQLRAFWDLKNDNGAPVAPGTYAIYGRFYLYYDPVVSLAVTVLQPDGTPPKLPDLVPTDVHLGTCSITDCAPQQMMDVCVSNQGDAAAGPFLVSIPPRSPIQFSGIDAGERECVAVPFMPAGVVGVDVNNDVVESNEGNNKLQFNLPAPVATGCDFVPQCPTRSATPTPRPTSHGPIPPTPTPTPPAVCTPVRCDPPGVLACLSGYCPGGCGYQCVTPTPTPPQPCCPFGALCVPELPRCSLNCCPPNADCTGELPSCTPCGGLTGASCPAGYQCQDDPSDQCAPPSGADCPGICVPFQPGQCTTDADCPPIELACLACPDGTFSCPQSLCELGVCRVLFPGCAPTPTPPAQGSCFRGIGQCQPGSSFPTLQTKCCEIAQLSASPVSVSWCPANQLDAYGGCTICSDPCTGIPYPTATPVPTCTPLSCDDGEAPTCTHYCPGGCGLVCAPAPPPTPTPAPYCTPPLCHDGEVYYCPGDCPNGCGTICVTPTPVLSGPAIAVEPSSQVVACSGAFTIHVSNSGSNDSTLVITDLSLGNGYSEGEYGTGFTWDASQIQLPAQLPAGTGFAIPVTYEERGYPFSRLELFIESNAVNTPHVYLAYHGFPCWTPTPTPNQVSSTATPTAAIPEPTTSPP